MKVNWFNIGIYIGFMAMVVYLTIIGKVEFGFIIICLWLIYTKINNKFL